VVDSLALFILAAAAAIAIVVFRGLSPRALMLLGTLTIPVGVGMAVLAFGSASAVALFTGGGIVAAGREYGIAVIVLALVALLGLAWPARPARPAPAAARRPPGDQPAQPPARAALTTSRASSCTCARWSGPLNDSA
jgi:hypothetical protein